MGHVNTLRPFFQRSFRPPKCPRVEPFSAQVDDVDLGPLQVTGKLLRRDPQRLLIAIHGLGGSVDSGYMALALLAAERMNISALLLNCRGADRRTGDIYHSGLTADLAAAVESEALSSFTEIVLLGYSIGGHIALRYVCGNPDQRVTRCAAICSPLDLSRSATDFDQPFINVYRGHVMDGLKEIYTAAYQRNPRGIVPEQARKIRKIRVWDERIIAPRFGFESADHYYATQSVGPHLGELKRESLYVGARFDPMVRARGVEAHLARAPIDVVWDDSAGHLGFGPGFDLGFTGPRGLEPQVLSWLFR